MVTTADEIATKMKQTSVAEFFERNRHLLGFDSKVKALVTCVKEAVDNSIDASEEMINKAKKEGKDYVLPEVTVTITEKGNDRYLINVIDNGPGIIKDQIPNVYTRMLFGSKFNQLKQGRGQQGIGIKAAVLYSQLTTGKSTHVVSKTEGKPTYYYDLRIDTSKNAPEIISSGTLERFQYDHGTEIELELDATYLAKGEKSVYEYMRRTSIVSPHAQLTLITPDAKKILFNRTSETVPVESKSIKPHPYGIEVGTLIKMAQATDSRNVRSFLMNDFSRMGATTVDGVLKEANVDQRYRPSELTREQCEEIVKSMQKAKIMSPPTDCLSPIGDEALRKSLRTGYDAEFVSTVSRTPSVYKGTPFLIEAAIAYGGSLPSDKTVDVIRFANKMPLQYNASACAITEVVKRMDWRRYGLQQSGGGGLPVGSAIIIVHMASVWIPYTSESKSSIAQYEPIMAEMKLALQECARELNNYLNKKHKAQHQQQRMSIFVKYADESVESLSELTGEKKEEIKKLFDKLITEKIGNMNQDEEEEQATKSKKEDNDKKADKMDDVDKFIVKEETNGENGEE